MNEQIKLLLTSLCAILLLISGGICLEAGESILIVGENGTSEVNENALDSALSQMTIAPLNDTEKEGLLYMVEEEKLAGDVYQTLGNQWNLQVFENIGEAEMTHEAAVSVLIKRYGLQDPTIDEVGKFSNSTLQVAYDDLIDKGMTSPKGALEVGAEIEEIDILDLQERIAQTDKLDLKLVYDNLMRGSRNHLRAFVRNLNRQGFEYEPLYLSKEEYYSIMNSNN
jgi:hypothetical protein